MAENITLANLVNLQNETTAVSTINNNNAVITSAFTDVLSRSGVSPNPMGAPLDMNNWPIMNLPPPGSANSPARLVDVTSTNPIAISLSLTGDVTAPASSGVLTTTLAAAGTSGHKVPYLDGNNTYSGQQSFTNTNTNIIPTTGGAFLHVSPVQAAQQGALLFDVNGVGKWQVGKQTDDSFYIFDTVGGRNVATATANSGLFIRGTNTNDNAAAGFVGEYISSTLTSGSAIALTTATPANITSISLTAGDWDVWGIAYFNPTSSTSITVLQTSISTTSATLNINPGSWGINSSAAQVPGANTMNLDTGPIRLSLPSTTTVFLVSQGNFTVSTLSGFGIIQARRVR